MSEPSGSRNDVGSGPTAVVQRDLAARLGDADRFGREVERIVGIAVLQRDVAERHIGGVVGEIERLAVGDVARPETLDLAEPADGLERPLEEPGVEVAADDRAELAGEGAGHPADAATDLDQRLLLVVGSTQTELGEVRRHFLVAGRNELFEREIGAGLVVEHPPGGTHDVVAARLAFTRLAGGTPRDQLCAPDHRRIVPAGGPVRATRPV